MSQMPHNYGMPIQKGKENLHTESDQYQHPFRQNYPQTYENNQRIPYKSESPKLTNPSSANQSFDGKQLSSIDTDRALQERYDDVRSQILNPTRNMHSNPPQNSIQSMNFNNNVQPTQPEMSQNDMFNQWNAMNMYQNSNFLSQTPIPTQYNPNMVQMKSNYAELCKDQEENPYSKFLIQQQMSEEEKDTQEEVLNQSMKMIINQAQAQIHSEQMMSNSQMNNQMMRGQNMMQQNFMGGQNTQQFYPQNIQNTQFESLQQLPKLKSQQSENTENSSDPPTNRVLEFNMAEKEDNNEVENFDDKPIKPAANFNFYQDNDRDKEDSKIQDYDEIPVGGGKNLVPKNPHDERLVGGTAKNVVEDVPIKPKVKNFNELLEKELKANPDATIAADEIPKSKHRKKDFLKRKKPVTAPPKNHKPGKYKYYAENFSDNPLGPIDSSQKPAVKQQKQTPFGNTAERKAAQNLLEPKEKKKSQGKKNFLVRGGGIGGGIGQNQTIKDKEDKPLKSDVSQSKKNSSKPKQSKGQKKIFGSDSDDENESVGHSDLEDNSYTAPHKAFTSKPSTVLKDEESENKNNDNSDDDDFNSHPHNISIPDSLLSSLPEKARITILEKMKIIDTEIAKQKKVLQNNVLTKKDLQQRLEDLAKDNEEFEEDSQREIQELKNYQEEEMRKIRKERKEFGEYQKELKSQTERNSGGKQEINDLKNKIDEISQEIKSKDKKSNAVIEKLKAELQFYNDENSQLQSEIRQIGKERINMMQRKTQEEKKKPIQMTQAMPTKMADPKPKVIAHFRDEEEEDDQQEEDVVSTPSVNEEPENEVEESDEEYIMVFQEKYHNKSLANTKAISEHEGNRGKIEKKYSNGKRELLFPNGVRKQIFPDGYTIVFFNNHDIKQTYPNDKSVYYFAENDTTQTTYSSGIKVFRFGNGQIEKHYPDSTKEIQFTDGTVKYIFADGEEESVFPDGMIQRIDRNGVKTIEMPDGGRIEAID
jgi:centromere protein J